MTQTTFLSRTPYGESAVDICARKHGGDSASKDAHKRVLPQKKEMQRRVYQSVKEAGGHGLTCRELAQRWAVGMNEISGRFSELQQAGMIEKHERRDGCGVWRITT